MTENLSFTIVVIAILVSIVQFAEPSGVPGSRPLKCAVGEISCDDGQKCIPVNFKCDDDYDCDDHSDEKNCGACEEEKVRCKIGPKCIWKGMICDGLDDCPNGTDEMGCEDSCTNSTTQYKCKHGHNCIDLTQVCNGKADCEDGSDEGIDCGSVCGNQTCRSPSQCRPTPEKAVCTCPGGYKTVQIGSIVYCHDINECNTTDQPRCSHICLNEPPGSFTCSCKPGYVLVENQYCKVRDGIEEAMLLYGTRTEIRSFALKTMKNARIISVPHDIYDFDVGPPPENTIYWTDVNNHAVYGVPMKAVNATFDYSMVKINYGLIFPVGITIDWKANNMYIADSGRKELIACSATGVKCTIVQKNVDKPRSLAIDPDTRELYWTDLGSVPKIEKSWLDGSNRSVFVTMGQFHDQPYGIVVDRTIERLFWVDRYYNKIESIKLDGTDRKKIYTGGNYRLFGVAVFEDHIFWSDASKMNIMTAHKFLGKYIRTLIKAAPKPRVLKVAHPYLYTAEKSLPTDDACQQVSCDGVCLQSNNDRGYTCACPPNSVISDSGCHRDLHKSQLYFSADTIYQFPLKSIGLRSALLRSITSSITLTADFIDVDPMTNRMIFADNTNHLIALLELDNENAKQKILYTGIGEVNGILVDWVSQNVFWTDSSNETVQVARLDGMAELTLFHSRQPRAIAMDIVDGSVYFSEFIQENSASTGQIMKGLADGTHNILVSDAGCANDIAVDQNLRRLYWTDSLNIAIYSVPLTGSLRHTTHWRSGAGIPFSIAIDGDLLYWTDKKSNLIKSVNRNDRNSVQELLRKDGLKSLTMWKQEKLKRIEHSCTINGGDCSHVCLRRGSSKVCHCPENMQLHANGLTCLEPRNLIPSTISVLNLPPPITTPGHKDTIRLTTLDQKDKLYTTTFDHKDKKLSTPAQMDTERPINKVIPTKAVEIENDTKGCSHGYRLLSNGSCVDVNECTVNQQLCSQICENEPGNYHCACAPGYLLNSSDTRNCLVDLRDYPLSYVIVADDGKLWKAFVETDKFFVETEKTDVTPEGALAPISVFDVDSSTKHIIYVQQDTILEYNPVLQNTTVIAEDVGQIVDIALDWIGQNIYYSKATEVGLCQRYSQQTNCRVLFTEKSSPKWISLCPCKGLMFWSNKYKHQIESAWMDGTNRKVIVKYGIMSPTSITVDLPAERIYWLDVHENSIDSTKFDGTQRIYLRMKLPNPSLSSLAVFESSLYVTAINDRLAVVDKLNNNQRLDAVSFKRPGTVRVVHRLKQMKMKESCSHMECSQLCLRKPDGPECACGNHFILSNDNKTCTAFDETTTKNVSRLHPDCGNCTNGGTCVQLSNQYICVCPENFTGPGCFASHSPHNMAASKEDKSSSSARIAGSVVAVLLLIAIAGAVAFYYRNRRHNRHRSLSQIIRYHANIVLRKKPEPDREELVSEVSMDNPSYQEYEDVSKDVEFQDILYTY